VITYTDLEDIPGWTQVFAVAESEIDDLAAEIRGVAGKTSRIVRGQRTLTRERLFQELAAALQFPHYFGENWDAVEECLGDLEWMERKLILVVTNADMLLQHHDDDLNVFASILQTVHDLVDTPLERVLFHCTPATEARTKERLRAAGLTV
jgi:RNAse (barnase) inhibitor barstar